MKNIFNISKYRNLSRGTLGGLIEDSSRKGINIDGYNSELIVFKFPIEEKIYNRKIDFKRRYYSNIKDVENILDEEYN
ncbi:MAG: hypothetical protein AABX77_00100 [Nanoarchaeota archaeon]